MEKQRRRTSTLTTSSMLRDSLTRKATIRPPTLLTVLPPVSPWKVPIRADLPAFLPPTTPTRHSTDMSLVTPSVTHTAAKISSKLPPRRPIRSGLAQHQLLSRPLDCRSVRRRTRSREQATDSLLIVSPLHSTFFR